jgi:hypothetical protein
MRDGQLYTVTNAPPQAPLQTLREFVETVIEFVGSWVRRFVPS